MIRFLLFVVLFCASVYIMNTKDETELKQSMKNAYKWCKENIKIHPACQRPAASQQNTPIVNTTSYPKNRWRY